MSYKRLTPCIFIAGGKAVRWFDDRTVLTEDVIALAKQYIMQTEQMNCLYLIFQILMKIMKNPSI